MTELDLDAVRADWRDASTHVMPHWNCCDGHRVAHQVPALIAEVERLRAEMETLRPVAEAARRAVDTDGVDEWNELVDVIDAQAIDASGGGA